MLEQLHFSDQRPVSGRDPTEPICMTRVSHGDPGSIDITPDAADPRRFWYIVMSHFMLHGVLHNLHAYALGI